MKPRLRIAVQRSMFIVGLAGIASVCTSCSKPAPSSDQSNQNQDSFSKFRSGKPYQATYSMPQGEERFYWDGQGHVRMDVEMRGDLMPRMINVADFNKHESTSWTEGTNAPKTYSRGPSRHDDPLLMLASPNVKPVASDSLGVRNIQGHNCHGWKGGLDPNAQLWIDDDCGCMVELSQGSDKLTLASFTPTAPSPSVFEPPAGYTQTTAASSSSGRRRRTPGL